MKDLFGLTVTEAPAINLLALWPWMVGQDIMAVGICDRAGSLPKYGQEAERSRKKLG